MLDRIIKNSHRSLNSYVKNIYLKRRTIQNTTKGFRALWASIHANNIRHCANSKFYFHICKNLDGYRCTAGDTIYPFVSYLRRRTTLAFGSARNASTNCSLFIGLSSFINFCARLYLHFAMKQFVSAGLRKSPCSV